MELVEAALFNYMLTTDGWARYSPALAKVAIASNTPLRLLYDHFQRLHEQAPGDKTAADVRTYLTSCVPDTSQRNEMLALLDEIGAAPFVTRDILDVTLRDFVAQQLSFKAAQYILTNHTKPDYDPAAARTLLEEATTLHSEPTGPPAMSFLEAAEASIEVDRPGLVPLLLSDDMDNMIGGGVAAGEMAVFLAGAKKGKTTILSIIAARNALQGRKVLYCSLEVNEHLIQRRLESALTELDYKGLIQHPSTVRTARKRVEVAGGNVEIVHWAKWDHSPADLIPVINYYQGFDLIIIDYLALMVPNRTSTYSRKDQRFILDQLGKDGRSLANEVSAPLVTAWQTNRTGGAADTVTDQDVAECYGIVRHCDMLMGISRTDAEKDGGNIRIHSILGRFNEHKRTWRFKADLERGLLQEVKR